MPDILSAPQSRKSMSGGTREVLIQNLDKWVHPPDVVGPFSSRRAFIKWFVPCLFVGLGGYIGSAGLHYASYSFVHQMDEWNATIAQFQGEHDINLAAEVEKLFSKNRDPIATLLGPQQQIAMGSLDKIAMFFPALFVALMLLTHRVELWAKIMVCTALLAATKGIIGAVTTVPDSSGWEICRDVHLQADGYGWLRENRTFFEIITVDFWWLPTYGHPLRYCSDMMFSGHTFFVTLYALGLYEVALIWTHSVTPKYVPDRGGLSEEDVEDNRRCDLQIKDLDSFSRRVALHLKKCSHGAKTFFRASVLFFVATLAIFQQTGEIYYVLLSRFHYTSDVVVALMFTFLFYTNGAISIFAKQWALRDFHFLFAGRLLPSFYFGAEGAKKWNMKGFPYLEDARTVRIPPCCVFSCTGGIENPPYPKTRTCPKCKDRDGKPLINRELAKNCRGCGRCLEDSGLEAKATEHTWISRGDIFVPFCCVPCCCLAGREHVYSDNGIDGFRMLINSDKDPTNNISDNVVDQMHMHEGISERDLQRMRAWGMGDGPRARARSSTSGVEVNRHFNPWAYRYSHSLSANFILDCENRLGEGHVRDQSARKCPGCEEMMPYSSQTEWKKWDYKYCIGCGHKLDTAAAVKFGDMLDMV